MDFSCLISMDLFLRNTACKDEMLGIEPVSFTSDYGPMKTNVRGFNSHLNFTGNEKKEKKILSKCAENRENAEGKTSKKEK